MIAGRVKTVLSPLRICKYSYPAANYARNSSSLVGRDFLTLRDFNVEEVKRFLWTAMDLKHRIKIEKEVFKPLDGKTLAMIFQKRSTRTRTSTTGGFSILGGNVVNLSPDEIHLGVNETIKDTARVLSRISHIILARVYGHSDVEEIATEASVPVISGLSNSYHPLQCLADFQTLVERYGSLKGMKFAWVGDGNNIINSIMMVAPKLGMNLHIATPKGYEVSDDVAKHAEGLAREHGTEVIYSNCPPEACKDANVIMVDTWVGDYQLHEREQRMQDFKGWQVTKKWTCLAADDWGLLHCLPRRPQEIDDETFYSKHSLVWDEAENRKWTVMSVLLNLLKDYQPTIHMPKF